MAQPRRRCIPDVTYHIYSRCHNKENMMCLSEMKDLLVLVINLALEKYDFRMIHYAIMDNHFHFIIKTTQCGPSISLIMQFIKSQYARRYNRIMNRSGAFWNERFGDVIIELTDNPEEYFHWLLCYIGYNPVKAGKVKDPRQYKYSSINAYLDESYISPVPITLHEYFINLGNTFTERVMKFLKYDDMYRRRLTLSFL